MRWVSIVVAVAAAACGRGESGPPEKVMHLERWDGLGVPVVGDIDLTMRGVDEESDLTTAAGSLELVCDPCVIEGGAIPVPSRPGRRNPLTGSLTVPRIDLGMVRGTLEIAGGRGTLAGRAAGGQAVEIDVSGTITFRERRDRSPIDIRVVFRPAADLATTSPQLSSMLMLLGPADASGAVTFQLTGELGQPKPVNRR